MAEQTLLDVVVPDELLRTAMARAGTEEALVGVELMPGVGRGAPPPLLPLLRTWGVAPLIALGLAGFLVQMVDSGIGILGPDIQRTFGLSDAGLGAVAFVSSASFLGLGIPLALWADRGQRRQAAAVALLIWALAVPLLALAPSVWAFTALLVVGGLGRAAPNSVHLSYLADAYPIEARARVMAFHRAHEPMARTLGAGIVGAIAAIAGGAEGWRWAMVVGLLGFPVAYALTRVPEPAKGEREHAHVLDGAGLADESATDDSPPRVLLGTAVQRLLRIRTLYFQFVAIAVLGFAAVGIPLFGSLYLDEEWGLDVGARAAISVLVGGAAFLGLPVAGLVGDRLFRRSPELPLLLAAGSLAAFGVIYATALQLPSLWMVIAGFVLAEACLAPLATAMTQTVAACAPPALRSLAFALFGIYSLVFGGFAGGVILGAISDARGPRFALTLMGPVTVIGGALLALGSRHVKGDITRTVEEILEAHDESQRQRSGGKRHALQVHHLDVAYGSQQVLFDVSLNVDEGEVFALLGTNGAGKSTLLRAVAGLQHPARGTIRIFGSNTTYLEAEQLVAIGVTMLPGGKVTFGSLTVDENLRAGSFTLRREPRLATAIDEVYTTFPTLAGRRDQPAGTLSGGEQQMLALGRALVHRPRLLLVDELTLGLAPMIVEQLLGIVRAINARGTTIVLVEQSVNLALTLADRAVFLERGEVRFDGSTAELLRRHDLLRPVFLTQSNGAKHSPPRRVPER
ncbi:MAG: branched-chain amino acid transport system ATP-binding protein [Acidimicrobiaceae bacterium]|jgi:ABC-type branched-subunit amino acid transport system ATPase component/sugar phosphate permease